MGKFVTHTVDFENKFIELFKLIREEVTKDFESELSNIELFNLNKCLCELENIFNHRIEGYKSVPKQLYIQEILMLIHKIHYYLCEIKENKKYTIPLNKIYAFIEDLGQILLEMKG